MFLNKCTKVIIMKIKKRIFYILNGKEICIEFFSGMKNNAEVKDLVIYNFDTLCQVRSLTNLEMLLCKDNG